MGFDFGVGDYSVFDGSVDSFEEEGFGVPTLDFDEALSDGELAEGFFTPHSRSSRECRRDKGWERTNIPGPSLSVLFWRH